MRRPSLHARAPLFLLFCLAWTWVPAPAMARESSPFSSPLPALPAFTPIHYLAQSGDSLAAVAKRFGVQPDEILSPQPLDGEHLLPPGQLLLLPPLPVAIPEPLHLLPDREVVYGPDSAQFDVGAYIDQTLGYLHRYSEYLADSGATPAASIINRVAQGNSINPRLLLALLEYTCQCVLGDPGNIHADDYLIGVKDYRFKGLYGQLNWIANQLSIGYYGWRAADIREFHLPDGSIISASPGDNAGTVALQSYFASLLVAQREAAVYSAPGSPERLRAAQGLNFDRWRLALDPANGFPALYVRMFGDYRERSRQLGDLLPGGLVQPGLNLPFEAGRVWSLTGGPHAAWQSDGPWAALDFAPSTKYTGCSPNDAWVTASAGGLVLRSAPGYLVQDLDGDGNEGTGWVLLYLHLHQDSVVPAGTYLAAGGRIGHPSCEGGHATGSHLHIARKYNGEWMLAGGAVPFRLDGWIALNGKKAYAGALTRGGETITANQFGSASTLLSRLENRRVYKLTLPVLKK